MSGSKIVSPSGCSISAESGQVGHEFFYGKKRSVLLLRAHKIREQLHRKTAGQPVIGLFFYRNQLHLRLENGLSGPDEYAALDPYTNRYPEYPTSFVVLSSLHRNKKYQARIESGWQGDFLILHQMPRQEEGSERIIVINLWAVFMFESLEIRSDGTFWYGRKLMAKYIASPNQFSPFLITVTSYSGIQIAMDRSWNAARRWIPHMGPIQACDALYTNDREGSFDAKKAHARMKELLSDLLEL